MALVAGVIMVAVLGASLSSCSPIDPPSVAEGPSADSVLSSFALSDIGRISGSVDEAAPSTTFGVPDSLGHVDPLSLPGETLTVSHVAAIRSVIDQMKMDFHFDGFVGEIDVTTTPASTALRSLCGDGELDLVGVDRLATDDELASCAAAGIELDWYAIGQDREVVIVHSDNYWLESIAQDNLALMLLADTWDEIDPTYPQRRINRYLPSPEPLAVSQLRRDFGADGDPAASNQVVDQISGTVYENDYELIRNAAVDIDALGLVSLGQLLAVNEVSVSIATIGGNHPATSDLYPLRRDLFLVVDRAKLARNETLAAFVAFYLNAAGDDLLDLGVYPMSQWERNRVRTEYRRTIATNAQVDPSSPESDS